MKIVRAFSLVVRLPFEDTHQALDISIVRNFVHVLSEDLPRLPLDPEIEFVIEPLSSTASVSTVPYCVIPTGLSGLNSTERGLFSKGLIRLNHSPLGASVIYDLNYGIGWIFCNFQFLDVLGIYFILRMILKFLTLIVQITCAILLFHGEILPFPLVNFLGHFGQN